MDFPKKMKRQVLASALSVQQKDGNILVVSVSGMEPKTKLMAGLLKSLGLTKRTLIVTDKDSKNVTRATRNIENVDIMPAPSLNTYEVLRHQKIVIMKEAVSL